MMTAARAASSLDGTLRAAKVPRPVMLVGHSIADLTKGGHGVDYEFTGVAPRTFSLMRSRMVMHDADATLFEATLKKAWRPRSSGTPHRHHRLLPGARRGGAV